MRDVKEHFKEIWDNRYFQVSIFFVLLIVIVATLLTSCKINDKEEKEKTSKPETVEVLTPTKEVTASASEGNVQIAKDKPTTLDDVIAEKLPRQLYGEWGATMDKDNNNIIGIYAVAKQGFNQSVPTKGKVRLFSLSCRLQNGKYLRVKDKESDSYFTVGKRPAVTISFNDGKTVFNLDENMDYAKVMSHFNTHNAFTVIDNKGSVYDFTTAPKIVKQLPCTHAQ